MLGDLPLLGKLFSFDNSGLVKRSLMVFLRTTILKDGVGKRLTAASTLPRSFLHGTRTVVDALRAPGPGAGRATT